MRKLEKVLKACANRRRIAILVILKKRREVTVGAIAKELRLSFRATSKHLAVLRGAGIVEYEKRSLEVWYSLMPPFHPIIAIILTSQ